MRVEQRADVTHIVWGVELRAKVVQLFDLVRYNFLRGARFVLRHRCQLSWDEHHLFVDGGLGGSSKLRGNVELSIPQEASRSIEHHTASLEFHHDAPHIRTCLVVGLACGIATSSRAASRWVYWDSR